MVDLQLPRIAVGVVAALSFAQGAFAAETYGRMTIEIAVDADQQWSAGTDWGKTRITERYRIVTHVRWHGELDTVDPLAPDFAQKQMARAAAAQRRIQDVQKRTGTTPIDVPKTPEAQRALMEKMQREQQACQGNLQCIMKVSNTYAPVLNAIAMQAAGASYAEAGADAEPVDLDAEEEARYARYGGYEGCPTTIEMRVDYKAEGAWADVGGMVPWKETYTANDRGNDHQRQMQCLAQDMVVDVKAGTFHSLGFGWPTPRGKRVYWDRLHGEEVNEDGGVPVLSEALSWASEQLRAAPTSGSRSTTLRPQQARGGAVTSGATHGGEVRVKLDWRFEPDIRPQ